MKPCPLPLKVMCIICICWAGLGLLSATSGIVMQFLPIPTAPAIAAMRKETWYILFMACSYLANLTVALLLLTGAIHSLKVKPLGRRLLLIYAFARIALGLVAGILTFLLILPRTMAATFPPAGAAAPPHFPEMMKAIMYISGAIGILVTFVVPVYVLITLNLRSVRDAFNGIFPPQNSFPPLMPSSMP